MGIVVGVLLNILASWAAVKFQNCEQVRRVQAFVADTIRNLQDYARSLDENRDRNGVIYGDILELIEAEIGVWGRNREHHDSESATLRLRRDVRDYLANTAKYCLETKSFLAAFTNAHNNSLVATTEATKQSWGADAQQKLELARQRADRLIKHIAQGLSAGAAAYLKIK